MLPNPEKLMGEVRQAVRNLAEVVHGHLTSRGCEPYVKTIYIGYTLRGEMVAAMYFHANSIEVALALPEDHPDMRLKDATHLTWPTMPLSGSASSTDDLGWLLEHIDTSFSRVDRGSHGVLRPNEFFMGRKGRNT